jgi:hypothetical protein
MEFVDVLVGWRLQRELQRREAALQEADRNPRPIAEMHKAPTVPRASEPKLELIVAQDTPRPREPWECEFCGRGFHGYGQFLNHHCYER